VPRRLARRREGPGGLPGPSCLAGIRASLPRPPARPARQPSGCRCRTPRVAARRCSGPKHVSKSKARFCGSYPRSWPRSPEPSQIYAHVLSLLVVRPGAIGDALLACPALAALRTARPRDSLLVMAHPAVGQLLLGHGLADRFISRDGPEADALFAPAPGLARDRIGPIEA